jgi:hypothetical protein
VKKVAGITYAAELAAVLDATLMAEEQRRPHALVRRLLSAADDGGPA